MTLRVMSVSYLRETEITQVNLSEVEASWISMDYIG